MLEFTFRKDYLKNRDYSA